MMELVSELSTITAAMNGNRTVPLFQCKTEVPTTYELIHDYDISVWAYCILAVYTLCFIISLLVYAEEIVFMVKHFKKGARLKKTIWILTFFPSFTLTSYIGIIVPRAGTLVDLVSNVFFVTCLYQFVGLMENYLGGSEKMWMILGESRKISIATLPLCCCCRCCLPQILLTRRNYHRITLLVVQVTALRPILIFIAAVLWTNGSYIPGNLAPSNAFLYIASLNLISSLLGTWGLMILKNAFIKELGSVYKLSGNRLSTDKSSKYSHYNDSYRSSRYYRYHPVYVFLSVQVQRRSNISRYTGCDDVLLRDYGSTVLSSYRGRCRSLLLFQTTGEQR